MKAAKLAAVFRQWAYFLFQIFVYFALSIDAGYKNGEKQPPAATFVAAKLAL